ncbi:reverse transcriptase domain-containing protein [Tanacetum coccineum]
MSTRLLFPLTEIDWKVGQLMRIDPSSASWSLTRGITQIFWAKDDEEKGQPFTQVKVVYFLYNDAFFSPKECGCPPTETEGLFPSDNDSIPAASCVPIQVSRQVTPLVQNTQEVYEEGRLPLDYRSRRSFHAAQAAYSSTSHASRTPTRGGVDNIFIRDAWGNWRRAKTDWDPYKHGVLLRNAGYFQAHSIAVITINTHKTALSLNMMRWLGRLQNGEHNISYRPRTAVKGQILADFLIEKPETDAVLPQSEVKLQEPWILFTDGSSYVDGSGAGLILTNPEGMEFTYALRFEFTATNNEAEYEALIAGLRIAARMGVRNQEANVDSRLVANHVLGEYVAKEDNMIQYLDKTKSLIQGFDRFTIRQVPRGDNKKADALSKIASTSFAHLSKQVLVEILKNKSISEMEISTVIEEQDPTWMTPIIEFISKGTLPHEQKDARRIRRTAQRFELRNGVLYRRSFLQPWLRCVGPIQADYVLREIHAGSCSMHSGPRSVVARALRSGYYWPTMHRDARDMIQKCNDCQGIDIAGPFPVAAGGLKFLIVAIDYFTKWIEAKAVATITGNQVKRFVWDNIVCRFGLPGEIVSDNGKQFCDNPFKDWCARLSITQRFASVKHPQTNGLVERANRSLGEGIKARLDRHKGRWVEELSHVLWAHRTTIKVSTGDTPFSLVYGTEAVIPAEIGMPTIRTAEVNIATNDDERRIDLDILEERREQAAIREEKAKLKMKGYYDAKVRGVSFRPGDFVYRANDASHAEDTGKLGPKWEGPYEVTEALGKGAYKLRDMDGRELPRTWNICNLKKCYL